VDDLDIDRVVYTSINYSPADYYMRAWNRYKWGDDGRTWDGGENPMPDYADLSAIAPFADVDLLDGVKAGRPDGEVPQETVADALDGYIEGFADLCGGRGPVHALDSVGGAYIMVAPSVSGPIAERFEGDDRAMVLEELSGRVNDYLSDVRDDVSDAVDGHDDVLDPDMVTHKNRVYKAPLSLHASLDGVVTPIATDSPAYDYTPVEAVTGEIVEETQRWAESFTDDYSDRVGQLVAALWGGTPEAWADTLETWLEEQRAEESHTAGAEATGSDDGPSAGGVEGQRTASIEDVYRALDSLDAKRVAEKTIVHKWNDSARSGKGKGFYPTWGPDSNGTANYVTSDVWHDTGADSGLGHHGTVVEMALISEHDWTRGEIAQGSDWVKGVRALRELGFDVPLPAADVDEDMSQYYSLDLSGIAADNGIEADPYDDNHTLLKACLHAREETPEVADEKPPYGALVAVAKHVGLDMDDADEEILGKTAYKVANRVFDDLAPEDV
jgi:putative DNA primase/helicase